MSLWKQCPLLLRFESHPCLGLLNTPRFGDYLQLIYPNELEVIDTTNTQSLRQDTLTFSLKFLCCVCVRSPVSLDCLRVLARSVFSYVYLLNTTSYQWIYLGSLVSPINITYHINQLEDIDLMSLELYPSPT